MNGKRTVKWKNLEFTITYSDAIKRFYVNHDDVFIGYISERSFDAAEKYLIRTFDKAFSKKYYGWGRILNNHNFSVALGHERGYDYERADAKYTIMRGAKNAAVYYIDKDFDFAAFVVNPFVKVEKINTVFDTMKEHFSFITGMRVYAKFTEYVLASGAVFRIINNNGMIIGSIPNLFKPRVCKTPEDVILCAAEMAM